MLQMRENSLSMKKQSFRLISLFDQNRERVRISDYSCQNDLARLERLARRVVVSEGINYQVSPSTLLQIAKCKCVHPSLSFMRFFMICLCCLDAFKNA